MSKSEIVFPYTTQENIPQNLTEYNYNITIPETYTPDGNLSSFQEEAYQTNYETYNQENNNNNQEIYINNLNNNEIENRDTNSKADVPYNNQVYENSQDYNNNNNIETLTSNNEQLSHNTDINNNNYHQTTNSDLKPEDTDEHLYNNNNIILENQNKEQADIPLENNINYPVIQTSSSNDANDNFYNEQNELDINASDANKEEKEISSHKLIKSSEINEPNMLSNNDDIDEQNINDGIEKVEQKKIINYYNEKEEEEEQNDIIMTEEERKNEFNFKTHFDITLQKENTDFFYKKVHKISLPLLSHSEMPKNLEYKSPLISSDSKYIACIGKNFNQNIADIVYVWELSNLYFYKYKFSTNSKVDSIAFSPNSKFLIIVYKDITPLMYDLTTGKKILSFEENGEEGSRQGYQCSFTVSGSSFALASTQSLTLWSIVDGKIKLKILDDSPIKIISSEHLINIDSELNCVIRKILSKDIIKTFKIKGIDFPGEILDARCSKDMEDFIYVIKGGIIAYNFKNKEYKNIQKFECGVEKATISEDGNLVLKTNLKNICINDIKNEKNVVTIIKDQFSEYKIDFYLKKLITIDNISITIQDYLDEKPIEQHIWLNKNPTKFEDIKFNKNFDILLAKISPNELVVYDIKTGYIIKKWVNFDENIINYTITKFGNDRIAVIINSNLVKIWNFISKREEATFYGYSTNSLCFNGEGNYILCGAKKGSQTARIWNISDNKYGTYRHKGKNDNINTVVHITSPIPNKVICCSPYQNPLIFNSYTKELLCKCFCESRNKFQEIYEINSDHLYDIFIIKGKDQNNKNSGLMYKMSNGIILQKFENYTTLLLAEGEGYIITKCNNINGGKLSSMYLKNLDNIIFNEFVIQTDRCKLINDNKTALIEYGEGKSKEFNFINIKDGNFMGKINYNIKINRNAEICITADKYNVELFVRYFEILSPKDTLKYLGKKICLLEDQNEILI